MTAPPTPRNPRAFRLYYAIVLGLAAVLLGALTPFAGAFSPLPLTVFLTLMILSEVKPVPLPGGGYATAGDVVDIAALIILGPIWTAWLNVASTFIVQGVVLRKPLVRVFHNMGLFTLVSFAAGTTFVAAGGEVGRLDLPQHIGPVLAAGAAYFLVNSMLVSTVIGLTSGPSPWRIWQRNFWQGILHHLSFVTLGALVAAVYFHTGVWGVGLLALPYVVARHSFGLYLEIKADLKDFVRALSEVLEEVDPYTRHHSVRVSQYAVRLARALGMSEREVDEIEYAALVHDLGKIGPQHQFILQKPGSLSHDEQRTLRSHPAAGAEIVAKVRALRRAAEIVRSHHERPDGKGYPYGLEAEDVPIGARVLNVSDAFDAMTSDRPYRRALGVVQALAELRRGAGTQFDAQVVEILLRLHAAGQFPIIPSPSSEDLRLLKPLRARG